MKRGSVAGIISNSRIGSPSDSRARSKISEKPLFGMNGNGMRRIDRLRGQHAGDLVVEMPLEPGVVGLAVISSLPSTSTPASRKRLAQIRPDALLAGGERVRLGGDRGELLGRGQAVGRALLDARELLALEAGDADHEEFVEIVARDGEEAQPLEQGMGRVARLLEHAPVEGEPGQLAVEIARARLRRPAAPASLAAGRLIISPPSARGGSGPISSSARFASGTVIRRWCESIARSRMSTIMITAT